MKDLKKLVKDRLKDSYFEVLKGNNFRNFLQIHIYVCNYVGFTLSIWGYGVSLKVKVFDPKDKLFWEKEKK